MYFKYCNYQVTILVRAKSYAAADYEATVDILD